MEYQDDFKHVRPEPHEAEELEGTRHQGCPNMDVITRGRRIIRRDFYCSRQRKYVEAESDCPYE